MPGRARAGPPERGSFGLPAWQFGPEGQAPVVTGMDIALVAGGLITTLRALLDG